MEDFYPSKNHGPDSGIGSDNGDKRLSTTEVSVQCGQVVLHQHAVLRAILVVFAFASSLTYKMFIQTMPRQIKESFNQEER